MRNRIILTAGAAGICVATLASALPATAATSTPAPAASSSRAFGQYPLEGEVIGLTPTKARLSLTDVTPNSQVTFLDGDKVLRQFKDDFNRGRLVLDVPVTADRHYDLGITETSNGTTSEPVIVSFDTTVTTIDAPVFEGIHVNGIDKQEEIQVKGTPFLMTEVVNPFGRRLASGYANAHGIVEATFIPDTELDDPRIFIRQTFGDLSSPVTEVRLDDSSPTDDVAPAQVEVSEKGGLSTVTAKVETATPGRSLVIRDALTRTIANVRFDGDTATYVTPTPSSSKLIRVSVRDVDDQGQTKESVAVERILSRGADTARPAEPVVSSVLEAGPKVFATVDVEPHATVTVKNSGGDVVGIRMSGSSSSVTIPITTNGHSGEYTVEQSTGSFPSDAVPFDVP